MARSRALALLVPFFSLAASAALAQPIVIGGSIVDREGKPIPGARATVYPYESPYAAARSLLERRDPTPLLQTPADAAGRFRLILGEVDFYQLEVSAPGFVAVRHELAPLVSDIEL